MNDYSSLLYSEKSVLATDCYDLTPLTYEERGMLPAKNPTENGFIEETRFLQKNVSLTNSIKFGYSVVKKSGF